MIMLFNRIGWAWQGGLFYFYNRYSSKSGWLCVCGYAILHYELCCHLGLHLKYSY